MKKIFSFLMVAVLLVAMAVPCFAENNNQSVIKAGFYRFNDELIDTPVWDETSPSTYQALDFTVNAVMEGVDVSALCVGIRIGDHYIDGEEVYYDVEQTDPYIEEYSRTEVTVYRDGWYLYDFREITVLNDTAVDNDFYLWFVKNTTSSTCDGSACAVADFDINGVCDTCGLALSYSVQRTYTPNNWPSELPSPPLGHDDNYHYVIMNINGYDVEDERGIYLHTFTPRQEYPTLSWDNRANGDFLTVTALIDDGLNVAYMNYHKYLLVNGEWVQKETSQSKYTARLGYMGMDDVVYSTLNLYTEEGTLFFPVPLWMAVESVVQGEMVTLVPEMGQTMMILTVLGVGLLALLILLHLFRKGLLMR